MGYNSIMYNQVSKEAIQRAKSMKVGESIQ